MIFPSPCWNRRGGTRGSPPYRLALIAGALLCGAFRAPDADSGATMIRDERPVVDGGTARIAQDGAVLELSSTGGEGVLVVTSRPARRWRLETGDVLLRAGMTRLRTPEDFFARLRRARPDGSLDVTVRRRDRPMTIVLPLSAYRCCLPPAPPAPPGAGDAR